MKQAGNSSVYNFTKEAAAESASSAAGKQLLPFHASQSDILMRDQGQVLERSRNSHQVFTSAGFRGPSPSAPNEHTSLTSTESNSRNGRKKQFPGISRFYANDLAALA